MFDNIEGKFFWTSIKTYLREIKYTDASLLTIKITVLLGKSVDFFTKDLFPLTAIGFLDSR